MLWENFKLKVTGKGNQLLFAISGAEPSNGNRGLGALAFGALEALYTAYPDAQTIFIDYYKDEPVLEYEHKGVVKRIERIGLRFSWKIFLPANITVLILGALILRIIPNKNIRKTIYTLLPKLEKISKVDTAYVISGGDSFSDIYGFSQYIYVALPQILFLLMKIPLVQLPQTYGPYKNIICRFIAKQILSASQDIYSRDEESLKLIESIIGNSIKKRKHKLSYDVGFLLEPKEFDFSEVPLSLDLKSGKEIIGVNISGLLLMGGYTRKNQFNLCINYGDLCHKIINHFLSMKCSILLIPHVLDNSLENDIYACEHIYCKYKDNHDVFCGFGNLDSREVKGLIGKCSFFIGARMHACIGAISQCIPTVSLAYSRKFAGVFKTIGIENCVIDLRTTSLQDAVTEIGNLYNSRDEIIKHLNRIMPGVKQSIQNIFIQKNDPIN